MHTVYSGSDEEPAPNALCKCAPQSAALQTARACIPRRQHALSPGAFLRAHSETCAVSVLRRDPSFPPHSLASACAPCELACTSLAPVPDSVRQRAWARAPQAPGAAGFTGCVPPASVIAASCAATAIMDSVATRRDP